MTITVTNGNGTSRSVSLKLWQSALGIIISLISIVGSATLASGFVASHVVTEWYSTRGGDLIEQEIDHKIEVHTAQSELITERMFNELLVEIEKIKILIQED